MSMIAENIGFGYRKDKWIFRNVNFEIAPGEIVGISGYSGCGKSTLSKVLANYLQPKEGRVTIDGKPVSRRAYQPVQLIYQHPEKALNPKWRMYKSLYEGFTPSQELLDLFGIRRDWFDRYPVEISGGEMQRFCIVRALGPDTRYLIADEMTTMLDAVTQAQIWKATLDICRERQLGLIVISHETELLAKLCSKIVSVQSLECGIGKDTTT